MTRGVYYNEFDPRAAAWLRALIERRLIPAGEVDTRSIADVQPDDLRGFTQHHFFAGIGGWSRALQLAGWPEDRPIWTGSCPCQPFSVAGKRKGTADERHVWPDFFRLIGECRTAVVIGEQVASKAGREWLSGVFADLEGVGYAGAGADLCAAGVGAPHIRQRLYWVGVADAEGVGRRGRANVEDEGRREQPFADPREGSGDVVDAASLGRREGWSEHELRGRGPATAGASSGDVADADDARWQGRQLLPERPDERSAWSSGVEWRRGADGKERRVGCQICRISDGLSPSMGESRNDCREEAKGEINGWKDQTSSRQDLPDLRSVVQSDEIYQRRLGGNDSVYATQILQHSDAREHFKM